MLRSLSCFAVATAAITSQAVLTIYTSRAAFEAATAGGTSATETFSTPLTLGVGDNPYNGVNYRIVGTGAGGNNISGGLLNGDEYTPYSLDLVFAAGTTAFGADFFGANTASGLTFTINGDTLTLGDYLASPGTGFFGVVSSAAFTTVDFGGGPTPNEIYSLDNLTYVSAIAPGVPGPAAALPFALMALRRRRKAQ